MQGLPDWPAIAAARRGDAAARVPLRIAGETVGSVARVHLPALRSLARTGWAVSDDRVSCTHRDPESALADLNPRLREAGLVVAWRDEPYPVFGAGGRVLARMERAASRFWGTLTLGAHANGWVAGDDGRPAALWIAQRAFDKATDPGLLDNLIGGGVPAGQTPWETLQREGWEEAGLDPGLLATAAPGRVIRLEREIPEGWQSERLHVFDLQLPADRVPVNQDGEVHRFDLLPVSEAMTIAGGGEPARTMTVDAALVTLDFALRRAPPVGAALDARFRALLEPA